MNEKELREYIIQRIPEVSEEEIKEIRDIVVYHNCDIDNVINCKLKLKEYKILDRSKDKHYFKVRMTNGGYKYVYMCEDLVRKRYENYEYGQFIRKENKSDSKRFI